MALLQPELAQLAHARKKAVLFIVQTLTICQEVFYHRLKYKRFVASGAVSNLDQYSQVCYHY